MVENIFYEIEYSIAEICHLSSVIGKGELGPL